MVEDGKKPDFSSTSQGVKPYLREWDKLLMRNGVLYRARIDPDTGKKVYQLVLPVSERGRAMEGLHDDLGHLGRDRTLDLLRARFFWPRMAEDVKTKLQRCLPCLKRKSQGPERAPLVNIFTSQPMELVCMDFLSLEPSTGGIENILVITDHFTKLAYAVPTRNQTAKTTAQALYNFFLIYGFPLRLHSDQGRNFESQTIKELCKLAGITKSRTTPYHAMGNGGTERMNQSLLNMLGCLADDQKTNWKKYVPAVVHAYNSTRHETTGYSPFFLMYGRHPRLVIDVAMGVEQQSDLEVDFTKSLQDRLDVAYNIATAQAKKSASRHKAHYDKRIRGSVVSVGDRVLVRNVGVRGKHKLANIWEDDVHIVIDQPNMEIPVFVVQKENKKGGKRTLHRNLLLPVNFLPLAEPSPTKKKQVKSKPVAQPADSSGESSSSCQASGSESDSSEEEERRYFLRSRLDPQAKEFVPGVIQDCEEDELDVAIEEEELDVAIEEEVADVPQVIDHIDEQGIEAPGDEERDQVEEQLQQVSREDLEDSQVEEVHHSPEVRPVPTPRPRRTVQKPDWYGNRVSHACHVHELLSLGELVKNMSSTQAECYRVIVNMM